MWALLEGCLPPVEMVFVHPRSRLHSAVVKVGVAGRVGDRRPLLRRKEVESPPNRDRTGRLPVGG